MKIYKIINLIPAIRAIIAEESLLPKIDNETPLIFKILKFVLLVKKNNKTDLSKTFKKLGPTWIKLGQFLSTRPDIIGEVLANKLKNLQDKVEPFSIDEAKEILRNEYKEEFENIFLEIFPSENAASIAQVHKAKIQIDNIKSYVAIKILRPKVEKDIKKDLNNFFITAKFLEKFFSEARRLRLTDVVKTLAESLSMEVDLRLEAAAQSEMRENTIDDKYFIIPNGHFKVNY